MAVLGRLLISSAERLDLPDVLSVDSYTAGDFKYLLKGLVNDTKPYILKGFEVIDPGSAIGTQSCSIQIADSTVFYPGSSAGPFYYGLPAGSSSATPLVPELRKNAVNYIYLTFSTSNTSSDSRAFWDPDKNGGVGGEFTQDVNTESVLTCQVNVSVGAFPTNTIPVAKVTVGPVVITAIQDARDMMFRLGTGGQNPNPYASYAWPSLPNSSYQRNEPPTTMVAGGANPFEGGDKNILSLKDWMDAVMTKLRELGGTIYWYDDSSTYSVINTFIDVLATTFKSKGEWVHSGTTPGLVTWTEDIQYKLTSDERTYILRAGNVTLANEQVAYLDLIRNQPINSADTAVAWTNGQPYVNTVGGSVGLFANLSQGDWIKRASDPNQLFLRVEQFYDSVNASGSVTTAALAKSIRLSANYGGLTTNDVARYDKGVYTSSNIIVSDRDQTAISSIGGDFSWLILRSDTIENVSNIVPTNLTISLIGPTANGQALVTTTAAHGLLNDQSVTIAGTTNYNGTYTVEVASTTTFNISISGSLAAETAGTANYATVTTAVTSTPYGLQLESANNGFNTDDTIQITGTTNYNGSYRVATINSTTFQIPVAGVFAAETAGTATLAKVIVKNDFGSFTLIQGESGSIGDQLAQNIKLFLGMTSDSQVHPDYEIPTGYNTLEDANFNSNPADNVTSRLSKLTGMMADKAQDKTLKYLTEATTVTNTANGSAQEITFTPGGSVLTILQPGSVGNATVTLPSASPGISLLANQSAYVTINRNSATTPTIIVANNSLVPVHENVVVIASRLTDSTIYIWNGLAVAGSSPIAGSGSGLIQVDLYDPVDTALPTGTVTIDGVTVNAGQTVLFSALSSGNNEIYEANGTGTTITGWTVQPSFSGFSTPSIADLVIIRYGNGFANQIGEFNGTAWEYNNTVRYFNGSDYWEQSSLITSSLVDNTTNGTVFSVAYAGSEYMVVDYSVNRNLLLETGTIYIVTDGTNVSVTTGGANLNGPNGVSFSGSISGSNILLNYTTTSSGNNATMKYSVKRWSNSAGGPGGVPSYSGAGASGVTSLNTLTGSVNLVAGTNITITPSGSNITIASTGGGGGGTPAGPTNSIQYNNAGSFGGTSAFEIDTTNNALNLSGLSVTGLSSGITLADAQASPTTLFSYAASNNFAVVEYSVVRNGVYRVGRFLVANDGTTASMSDDNVDTGTNGLAFSATISGSNVVIQYTTTATGFSGTFKYAMRRWN